MHAVIARSIDKGMDGKLLKAFVELPYSKEVWVKRNMKTLRENATPPEITVAKFLSDRGVKFVFQAPMFHRDSESIYFADFLIRNGRIVIEVDGKSHIGTTAKANDLVRELHFKDMGYRTIRVWNSWARKDILEDKLKDVLKFAEKKKAKEKNKAENKEKTEAGKKYHNPIEDSSVFKAVARMKEAIESNIDGRPICFICSNRHFIRFAINDGGNSGRYETIFDELRELREKKGVLVYFRYECTKAKEWMGDHIHNRITREYVRSMRVENPHLIELDVF